MIVGDVIGIVQAAIELGKAIKGKSDQVKANKRQCQELEKHIEIITKQLQTLNRNTPCSSQSSLKDAIAELGNCLIACDNFISEYTEKHHWYQRILHSGGNAASFERLHNQLFKFAAHMNTAIGIQLLDDYHINTQAIEEDIRAVTALVTARADEMVSLQQTANERLATLLDRPAPSFNPKAAIVAPGATLGQSGAISDSRVEMAAVYLPSNPSDQLIEHAKALFQQFLSGTGNAEGYILAPPDGSREGAKCDGKITGCDVAVGRFDFTGASSLAPKGKK